MDDLKRRKETIKGDWDELAKNPPMVKLVFSLGLKFNEWMNGKNVP